MSVRPGLNIRTLDEFVRYAKANPSKASFASPGNGTAQHLAGEMFNTAVQTKMIHVPYRGDAPAITDMMGETVDAMFATLTVVLPYIASGKLTAIALANGSRVEKVPNIPTFAEAGMKNFEAATWFGVLAPASLSKPLRSLDVTLRSISAAPRSRALAPASRSRSCTRSSVAAAMFEHTQDAQFSIAHGLALGAHRIPTGKAWQDPKAVYDPSVLGMMGSRSTMSERSSTPRARACGTAHLASEGTCLCSICSRG